MFRLEGPAAVFHFRGHPHVHAFVNVAMDGDAPLSVGELLGHNPVALEGDGVRALFERALRAETGAELAYYPPASVVGRLRSGSIRAGDVYTLESWQESTVVVSIAGAHLGPALRAALREQGLALDPKKTYAVATTEHAAEERAEELGRIDARREGPLLRELTVAHLRAHGFPSARG